MPARLNVEFMRVVRPFGGGLPLPRALERSHKVLIQIRTDAILIAARKLFGFLS